MQRTWFHQLGGHLCLVAVQAGVTVIRDHLCFEDFEEDFEEVEEEGHAASPRKAVRVRHGKPVGIVQARSWVLAAGCRPTLPDIPGAHLAITSDDLFWRPEQAPGRTLVIGASYVGLEIAGFLSSLGTGPVSLAMRSQPLRGFDVQMADLVLRDLEHQHGVHVIQGQQPAALEQQDDGIHVRWAAVDNSELKNAEASPPGGPWDTVIMAIGRAPNTTRLGLPEHLLHRDTGKLRAHAKGHNVQSWRHPDYQQLPDVYALGDIVAGRPELTPLAIATGKQLG